MKYLYNILFPTIFIVLQLIGTNPLSESFEVPRKDARSAEYRMPISTANLSPPVAIGTDVVGNAAEADRPYGLHYDGEENSWTLHATVLQLKKTSVYGRPGEIAQIEYSRDGETFRQGWIVLKLDDYSFVEETSKDVMISIGQSLELYISGVYVSERGLDWEKCPKDDTYCMYAGFVEGGFPISEDYDGLTLCPSNTIIRSGFLPGDWINGMLAWKVRT
jgi:hypothetical protein